MSYRMSYRVTDHTTLGVRRRVDARQAERAKEVAPGRRVREHVRDVHRMDRAGRRVGKAHDRVRADATVQRPARQPIRACAPRPEADGEAEVGGEEATVYEGEEATVYKRKKGGYRAYKPQDNRDQLL